MGYRPQMKKGRLPVAGWRPFVVRAAVLGEFSPDIRENIRENKAHPNIKRKLLFCLCLQIRSAICLGFTFSFLGEISPDFVQFLAVYIEHFRPGQHGPL